MTVLHRHQIGSSRFFLISNTFKSNAKLKLAKNQAKVKTYIIKALWHTWRLYIDVFATAFPFLSGKAEICSFNLFQTVLLTFGPSLSRNYDFNNRISLSSREDNIFSASKTSVAWPIKMFLNDALQQLYLFLIKTLTLMSSFNVKVFQLFVGCFVVMSSERWAAFLHIFND